MTWASEEVVARAGALVEESYRVLCVDLDPQANLTAGLGINLNTVEVSMADVLVGRATIDEVCARLTA